MEKIYVITSIYWKYDILKQQPKQSVPVEFICFTEDDDFYVEQWAINQWNVVVIDDETLCELHPRMWAKRHRTHPFKSLRDMWISIEDWSIVIWMDWSARLLSETAIEDLVKWSNEQYDISVIRHPERNDIYEEANFCVDNNIPKYKDLPMIQQVEQYRKKWHPEWYWLSATGLLIMRYSPRLESMLDCWRYECLYFTYQDQLSFDYLVWLKWIDRELMDINLWNNEYINFLNPHIYPEK